ncbi:MAG: hypothetical protein J6V50_01755 [Clostridia bacterium]|nr:hypothetical protein [Clostridia bacterium]
MHITIIADSKRHDMLAAELIKLGHAVTIFRDCKEISQKIVGDMIILPIPSFTKDDLLNLKGATNTVSKDEFSKRISDESFIISCNCEFEGKRFIDINKFEPFVSMNAVPSAEGAISLAMQHSDIALFESRVLIIGYGRIGRIVANRLDAFNAKITVVARKPKDRFAAVSEGFASIDYDRLDEHLGKFDFIFQTVPYPVLNAERLRKVNGLIIELSSKGIGSDLNFAKANGINLIYAPGIPEKYSGITAGKILIDSIKSIIFELE